MSTEEEQQTEEREQQTDGGEQQTDGGEQQSDAHAKAQEAEEKHERAKEKMKEVEENPPDNLEDWPDDEAKYETFGGPDADSDYDEHHEEALGEHSVRHHEDGSVEVKGEKADDPDNYKGEPIPGGPTDPEAPAMPGEEKHQEDKGEGKDEAEDKAEEQDEAEEKAQD